MGVLDCRCSACGARVKVGEQYAGREAKCPNCSAPMRIPVASGAGQPLPEAAPNVAEEPEEAFPRIVTDSPESGGRVAGGSAAARRKGRTGDRTVRLALVLSAASAVLLIAAVGAFRWLSPEEGPASPASDRPSAPGPLAPPTSKTSASTLVLDWPEGERADAMVYVDGSEQAVPASGKAEFRVAPGEHAILLKRRGYEPIEMSMSFEPGAHHHFRPEWKEVALARADPKQPPAPEPDQGERAAPGHDVDAETPGQPTAPSEQPGAGPEPRTAPGGPAAEPGMPAVEPAAKPATPPTGLQAAAEPADPEAFLAGKDLRRLSDCFALAGESAVSNKLREVESLKKKAFGARGKVEEAQQRVDAKKKLMLTYVQQSRELGAKLSLAGNVKQHNQIVAALNELESRILILRESKQEEQALEEAQAAASAAREEYTEGLIALRRLYDEIGEKYEALAAAPAVARTIAQYNEAHAASYRLGPTSVLARMGTKIERLEETVLSEAIDLRRGQGGLWYVTTMFNGKFPQEMAIDTGASIISLPWETAEALGLMPGGDDAKMLVGVADGRFVEAWRVVAETVRVGKFTARNVECVVMPPGAPGSPPLLGLSFLRNFDFRIDPGKGQLIMSQLETE